jgi:hypothetical protein
MFFGPNCGMGALGATKAQKAAAKAKHVVAVAKKKAAKKAKAIKKALAKATKQEAVAAKRLAAIRAKAGLAVTAGAAPQAAARSALVADAQANPGEPLVASPAAAPALMSASQPYYEEQMSAQEPVMSEWQAVEEITPDPSAEDIGESEMVDVEDASDVNTQEAAGEIEAEGAVTPYPGEEIPAVTGDEERLEYQEAVGPRRRGAGQAGGWGGGFFGMGAAAAAKAVAKSAAKKAVAKGATPAQAVAVARKVARSFFAAYKRGGFFSAGVGAR